MFKRLRVAAIGFSVLAATATPALSQGTLRIGMTAADIPQTTGQPDQGFEGYRFAGYTIYDALVNWDLSKADTIADIKPGLATEWSAVEGDPKRWIFKLRQGVKFHDGTDFDADVVVWNLESTIDLDVTAAETLIRLVHNLRDSGRDLVFARVGSPVLDVFRRCGLLELLGEDHLFLTVDGAVQDCLHSRLAVIATLEAQLSEAADACRLARAVAEGKVDSGDTGV